MKRWFKRLACVVGCLFLVLAGWVLAEHFRGEWALGNALKMLAERGESLSISSFKPKRPPSEQNVFIGLLPLTNQVANIVSNLEEIAPSMALSSPGHAPVLVKLNQWSRDGKSTNDWQQFAQQLAQAQDAVAALETAAQKPAYDSGVDYDTGFVDLELQPIAEVRRSCQLLSWSALDALKRNELDNAHKHLIALVTLIAKQSPEPLVILQLVRRSCAMLAFNTTWQALQSDGWTDAQLAALSAAWQTCDFLKDMAQAMQMERAMTLDFYNQIGNSRKKLAFVIAQRERVEDLTDGMLTGLPTRGVILNWVHVPLWRMAWLAQDELASLEQWQFTIERERVARTNGWAALASMPNEPEFHWRISYEHQQGLGWYDRLRFLFSSEEFSVTDLVIQRTLEAQTQQQMVLAALGIQHYRLRTGRLPAQLADLVPEYVPVLPHDFMDRRPLRYRRSADGDTFLLYSVGDDGKDDGGNPAQRRDKKGYRQIWDGVDAVWPSGE